MIMLLARAEALFIMRDTLHSRWKFGQEPAVVSFQLPNEKKDAVS
jgi:hypothetical protein